MQSSTMVTVGFALDVAHQRGMRVDVETTTGRAFVHVLVGGIDRFCVILLDGHKAHVVSREHVVSVSLDQSMLLEITTDNAFVAEATA
ncbi:MAG TPA: hypothetical protein VK640_16045 [Actinomycetes bacterium]|nr:hypothetical protein [Actinomycetes bacterium]